MLIELVVFCSSLFFFFFLIVRKYVDGCHSEPDAEILNSAGGGMGVYAHGKYAGAGYTRLEYAVPTTQGGGKKSRRKNKQNR